MKKGDAKSATSGDCPECGESKNTYGPDWCKSHLDGPRTSDATPCIDCGRPTTYRAQKMSGSYPCCEGGCPNEAITDARIDAYEQYAKGSVGACRQDIAELVAEVRRLRAEPRTDYPIRDELCAAAVAYVECFEWPREHAEDQERMRRTTRLVNAVEAMQKRSDG